jgi:hypothetical protein
MLQPPTATACVMLKTSMYSYCGVVATACQAFHVRVLLALLCAVLYCYVSILMMVPRSALYVHNLRCSACCYSVTAIAKLQVSALLPTVLCLASLCSSLLCSCCSVRTRASHRAFYRGWVWLKHLLRAAACFFNKSGTVLARALHSCPRGL